MLPLIRTDRFSFVCHSNDPTTRAHPMRPVDRSGWFDVDAPIADSLTIKQRAVSSTEMMELMMVAKMLTERAMRDVPEPTTDEVSRMENAHLAARVGRRSVVEVIGQLPEPVRLVVDREPGAIVDFLGPVEFTQFGAAALARSMAAESPFGDSSSAP